MYSQLLSCRIIDEGGVPFGMIAGLNVTRFMHALMVGGQFLRA